VKTYATFSNFLEERYFGFANGDDGERYFIHGNEFAKAGINVPPPVGTRLAFDVVSRPQGFRGVNVEVVE
jgi:cold shock CspA family protein